MRQSSDDIVLIQSVARCRERGGGKKRITEEKGRGKGQFDNGLHFVEQNHQKEKRKK